MEHQAYRCCLATLAGFASNHCIGPGLRRRPAVCSPTSPPRRGIRPSYSGLLVQGTANSPPSTTKNLEPIAPNPFGATYSECARTFGVALRPRRLFLKKQPAAKSGADGQYRTDDLRFTKPLLYQLSYIGEICVRHYATFAPARKQIEKATAW